jgi:hypothetical protein
MALANSTSTESPEVLTYGRDVASTSDPELVQSFGRDTFGKNTARIWITIQSGNMECWVRRQSTSHVSARDARELDWVYTVQDFTAQIYVVAGRKSLL